MTKSFFILATTLTAIAAFTLFTTDRAAFAAPTTAPAAASQPTATLRGKVLVAGSAGLEAPDLTHVVVSLASNPALDAPPNSHAVMGQRDKAFVPNFLVVQKGTDVEFPNWDEYFHNVFSRSAAAPAFDLDRYPYGQSKTRKFEKLGVVQIYCNIHPQMRASVVVVANRFFARADAEGCFELKDIPAGKFEIVVWHERCDEMRKPISVDPRISIELSFTLDQSRKSIMENTPPERGNTYGGVERGLGLKRERLNLPVVKDAHPSPDPAPDK